MIHVTKLDEAASYINKSEWDSICYDWLDKNDNPREWIFMCGQQRVLFDNMGDIVHYFNSYDIPYTVDILYFFKHTHPELYEVKNGITIMIPALPEIYWIKNATSNKAQHLSRGKTGALRLNLVPIPVILEIEKRFG